jgi:uncharacterized Zn finger protein
MLRRNLPSAEVSLTGSELVPIASFRDVLDAELAVSSLAAAGIEAELADDSVVGVVWTYSVAVGGVKVMVSRSDVDAARGILDADHSAELEEELGPVIESEAAERCPRCGSADSETYKLVRPAAAAAILTGLPLILWGERNHCRQCGRFWKSRRH